MSPRVRSMLRCVAIIVVSWLLGGLVVRLGLDAVDRTPYSEQSEAWYLVVAVAALTVALGGSAAAFVQFRRRGGGRPRPDGPGR